MDMCPPPHDGILCVCLACVYLAFDRGHSRRRDLLIALFRICIIIGQIFTHDGRTAAAARSELFESRDWVHARCDAPTTVFGCDARQYLNVWWAACEHIYIVRLTKNRENIFATAWIDKQCMIDGVNFGGMICAVMWMKMLASFRSYKIC